MVTVQPGNCKQVWPVMKAYYPFHVSVNKNKTAPMTRPNIWLTGCPAASGGGYMWDGGFKVTAQVM